MIVLCEERQTELVVKKSRFIAIAKKCSSLNEVKALVEQVRKEHPDASHVVHAAVINNEFSFSDDREPKNTAGRPAFEVLKGSGISNICILIVRYFGGTLLGTGGLVKAYGDSAKLVLDGIKTEELIEKDSFSFSIPYDLYEMTKRMLLANDAQITAENFDTTIEITFSIPKSLSSDIEIKLGNLSSGKITLTKN